jgi:predicted membrane protein (TIGR00267 family)
LAALLILVPFFTAELFPAITWAYYTAIGLALLTLFGLGLFLGHVSHENLIIYGIKTVIAGLASILISFLLDGG